MPGQMDVRIKWRNTTFIELVVDGEIVDLNRFAAWINKPSLTSKRL